MIVIVRSAKSACAACESVRPDHAPQRGIGPVTTRLHRPPRLQPEPEVGRSGPFSLARVAARQAASLADGDSAAMTVSAETGIENMGKS